MPFKDCICFQLGKTVRQIAKVYRNEISSYNLTHGQFFMIVAIMEEEGTLPSELSVKTAQDRAATTGVLDRLVKDGWIERKQAVRDRRSHRIFLTQKGTEHKKKILELFEKVNLQYLSRFSQDEWVKMQDFLSRLEI